MKYFRYVRRYIIDGTIYGMVVLFGLLLTFMIYNCLVGECGHGIIEGALVMFGWFVFVLSLYVVIKVVFRMSIRK